MHFHLKCPDQHSPPATAIYSNLPKKNEMKWKNKTHHHPQLSTTTKKKQNETTKLNAHSTFPNAEKNVLKNPLSFPNSRMPKATKIPFSNRRMTVSNKARPKPFAGMLLLKYPSRIHNWTNFKIILCNTISIQHNLELSVKIRV